MNGTEEMDRNAVQFTVAQALNRASPLNEADLDRLALLPLIEYGQVRKAVADQLGIPVAYLDAEITKRQKELTPAATTGSGKPLEMPTIVPAEHPVAGALLLQTMLGTMNKYLCRAGMFAVRPSFITEAPRRPADTGTLQLFG